MIFDDLPLETNAHAHNLRSIGKKHDRAIKIDSHGERRLHLCTGSYDGRHMYCKSASLDMSSIYFSAKINRT